MKTKASRDHRLELRNQALEAELAVLRAENLVLRAQLLEATSYYEDMLDLMTKDKENGR